MSQIQVDVVDSDCEVFSDDVCFEILSFIEESWSIINACSLVSKQWLNVIRNRSRLYLAFWKEMNDERANQMLQSRFLGNIHRLMIYKLDDNAIYGEVFYRALQGMNNLTSLNISSQQIGPEGAKLVSGVKQLEKLILVFNNVGTEGAKYISEMENLTSLIIRSNNIGDEGAIHLSGMKKLTNLDVSDNMIREDGMRAIRKMTQLRSFVDCGSCALEEVSKMDQLTYLDVSHNLSGAAIGKFNNLTWLSMVNTCIGDNELELISKYPKLTKLFVSNNFITSEGVKHLSEMKQLKALHIGDNGINEEGVKIISEMKQLTELNVEGLNISENDREVLLCMKSQLKSLNITGCEEIPGAKYESSLLDPEWF